MNDYMYNKGMSEKEIHDMNPELYNRVYPHIGPMVTKLHYHNRTTGITEEIMEEMIDEIMYKSGFDEEIEFQEEPRAVPVMRTANRRNMDEYGYMNNRSHMHDSQYMHRHNNKHHSHNRHPHGRFYPGPLFDRDGFTVRDLIGALLISNLI